MASNSFQSCSTTQTWNTLCGSGVFTFRANESDQEDIDNDKSTQW